MYEFVQVNNIFTSEYKYIRSKPKLSLNKLSRVNNLFTPKKYVTHLKLYMLRKGRKK